VEGNCGLSCALRAGKRTVPTGGPQVASESVPERHGEATMYEHRKCVFPCGATLVRFAFGSRSRCVRPVGEDTIASRSSDCDPLAAATDGDHAERGKPHTHTTHTHTHTHTAHIPPHHAQQTCAGVGPVDGHGRPGRRRDDQTPMTKDRSQSSVEAFVVVTDAHEAASEREAVQFSEDADLRRLPIPRVHALAEHVRAEARPQLALPGR